MEREAISISISRHTFIKGRSSPGFFPFYIFFTSTNNIHNEVSFPCKIITGLGLTMNSTVAVAFDPRLEMGIPRSSYTWPVLESGPDLLGHDLSSVGHGSDASMTPPSGSRSLTSSPPRFSLTPEQRELKRQRDQARRDSKSSARVRRAMSTYSSASQSPTLSMHEFSSASPVPVYSTAPSQISLLAEPATTMAGSYMSSYSTSPLPDHGSPMFTSHFSSL